MLDSIARALNYLAVRDGYLVPADMVQCTRCRRPRLSHPGMKPASRSGLEAILKQDGCDRFECLPFHVVEENGTVHDFATSQEAIAFARS